MSKIRKAHSVEILDRRLRDCEAGGGDAMELVGIYDELARVERKWLVKAGEREAGRPAVRPLASAGQLNQRFERLRRLVESCLRQAGRDTPEQRLLQQAADALHARRPLPVATGE